SCRQNRFRAGERQDASATYRQPRFWRSSGRGRWRSAASFHTLNLHPKGKQLVDRIRAGARFRTKSSKYLSGRSPVTARERRALSRHIKIVEVIRRRRFRRRDAENGAEMPKTAPRCRKRRRDAENGATEALTTRAMSTVTHA